VARRIVGSENDAVTRTWTKLHNENRRKLVCFFLHLSASQTEASQGRTGFGRNPSWSNEGDIPAFIRRD
jgi:hypothetical protein